MDPIQTPAAAQPLTWKTPYKPKAPRNVSIELVPTGVSRNASCKGCGQEMSTNGYRIKTGKAKTGPSWHPACYEPKLNFPASYLDKSVELNVFGIDIEAYECLMQWAKDAHDASLPPSSSSSSSSSSSVPSTGLVVPAGDLPSEVTAEGSKKRKRDDDDDFDFDRYGCVVTLGPAFPRVRWYATSSAPAPLPLLDASTPDAPEVSPPKYPAPISSILAVLEKKKKRHVVGLAAMKMSMSF